MTHITAAYTAKRTQGQKSSIDDIEHAGVTVFCGITSTLSGLSLGFAFGNWNRIAPTDR